MSTLTLAVHKRFWQAMGEHFGKRWLDEYGSEPTKSWMDLLNRFSQDDIRIAITLIGPKGWAHPPTLSQFEPLLIEGARKRFSAEAQDWIRGYWRSLIVYEASHEAVKRELIEVQGDFEQFLITHRKSLGPPLLELLNDAQAMDRSTGERTDSMHVHVARRARETIAAWRPRGEEDRKLAAAGGEN